MDEQTTQQPINQEIEQVEHSEASQVQEDVGTNPEVSLTEDGELNFSDDFFGDIQDTPENENKEVNSPSVSAPSYYTDDDLQNIPYEQWEEARMPEEVKRYAKFLNAQTLARQQAQQRIQQIPSTPPNLQEPKQYTAKELNQEAISLAAKNLGLKSADDIDEYDSEHRTAVDMARQELMQKRNADIASYQQKSSEWQDFQKFNIELLGRPDFRTFDQWFINECKVRGTTPEQVQAGLFQIANNSDGGYKEVQRIVSGWYNIFKNSNVPPKKATQRVKTPPILESSRGGNFEGRKSVNLKTFGELDDDAQARALIDMGIV